jgi:hypothetical protein
MDDGSLDLRGRFELDSAPRSSWSESGSVAGNIDSYLDRLRLEAAPSSERAALNSLVESKGGKCLSHRQLSCLCMSRTYIHACDARKKHRLPCPPPCKSSHLLYKRRNGYLRSRTSQISRQKERRPYKRSMIDLLPRLARRSFRRACGACA